MADSTLKITVCRLEMHPNDEDTYIVGFNAECTTNGKMKQLNALVPISTLPEGYSESDVVEAGWAKLEILFTQWHDAVKNQGQVVGSTFVPGTGIVQSTPPPQE